jgi:hypothetical protein
MFNNVISLHLSSGFKDPEHHDSFWKTGMVNRRPSSSSEYIVKGKGDGEKERKREEEEEEDDDDDKFSSDS